MNTTMTRHDDRTQANSTAKATAAVRFSAPDQAATNPAPRPVVDDDDAQWVTQRMFDHYNG
jgi:hypothetical protein